MHNNSPRATPLPAIIAGLSVAGMALTLFIALLWAGSSSIAKSSDQTDLKELRALYQQPPETWPRPVVDASITPRELAVLKINKKPASGSLEKLRFDLGKKLFEDPILSASGQISCQNCHNKRLGWGDGLPVSHGHDRKKGRRNSPAIFNAAYQKALFWDGRAGSLEEQATGPLQDPVEMNAELDVIVQRLNDNKPYRISFKKAFDTDQIDVQHLLTAIATFEKYLEKPTPLDRFLAGNHKSLSSQQIWGLHLFRTKGGCMNCHNGPLLSDGNFHNIGLTYYGQKYQDLGHHGVSQNPQDVGKFRTPSLRHLRLTGPYMHNGLFTSLRGIINMYDAGGANPKRKPANSNDPLFPVTSKLLVPLELTQPEKAALLSFLQAL